MTWMRSFTDMRLAIATRLGVEEGDEDYWHSLPDDDPRAQVHDIYDWLGFLQETLVEAVQLTDADGVTQSDFVGRSGTSRQRPSVLPTRASPRSRCCCGRSNGDERHRHRRSRWSAPTDVARR